MNNIKKKNNARNGGAVSSPTNVDFINTGHAAQARYIAALANPFAAPAVPIPDSFLPAHCCKAGREIIANVTKLVLGFNKTTEEVTGDYELSFRWWNGATIVGEYTASSEVGSRLVAAGLAFEDGTAAADIGGFINFKQTDYAYAAAAGEIVSVDERLERNRGYGSLVYKLNRRQMLEFEGNGAVSLEIEFDSPKIVIAKFAAIMETDGKQGFTEDVVSNGEFLVTSSMDNVHAGIFSDIPHPRITGHLPAIHTDLSQNGGHHFKDVWSTAASWVSSAAGWAWKHKNQVASWANKAGEVYRDMVSFGGSISGAIDGSILSIGAGAAPLLLA